MKFVVIINMYIIINLLSKLICHAASLGIVRYYLNTNERPHASSENPNETRNPISFSVNVLQRLVHLLIKRDKIPNPLTAEPNNSKTPDFKPQNTRINGGAAAGRRGREVRGA